jgi:hypothetical protein
MGMGMGMGMEWIRENGFVKVAVLISKLWIPFHNMQCGLEMGLSEGLRAYWDAEEDFGKCFLQSLFFTLYYGWLLHSRKECVL